MADDRPDVPQRWDPSRSHVPDLESFLQDLYIKQFVSVEPTSAQFSVLSQRVSILENRVSANSATGGGSGSVTSAEADAISAHAASALSQAVSVLSQAISSVLDGKWSVTASGAFRASVAVLGNSARIESNEELALSGTYVRLRAGAASVFIDLGDQAVMGVADTFISVGVSSFSFETLTSVQMGINSSGNMSLAGILTLSGTISSPTIDALSNAISVLSNQVSALSQAHSVLSQAHSVLSQAVSVISQQVSALSQSLSAQAAALSVRIDTQSQSISVLSQSHSALSQAVSIISVQVVSALSIANAASAAAAAVSADLTSTRNVLSNQISVLSQQVSALSQDVSARFVSVNQSISVLSQQASVTSNALSALSQAVSVLSQAVSVLSNTVSAISARMNTLSNSVSVVSNALSALSQAVSVLSQAVSVLSAAGGGGISIVPTPGGRLTLTSATPVMVNPLAAVQSAVKVFYTPYTSNALPIFDGTNWVLSSLTELEMSLDTSVHVSATNYDVFAVNDGGTRRIGSGPAWASDTARALSIVRLNGLLVNASTFSARYGSLAVSVASAQATYLGTFRTTSLPGQTAYAFDLPAAASATESQLYLWNMYNRRPVSTAIFDNTDTWTYAGAGAYRSRNGSTGNRVSFVLGMNEDIVRAHFSQLSNSVTDAASGIGLDSTTVNSGYHSGPATTVFLLNTSVYTGVVGLGYHFLQALEFSTGGTATFYGDGGVAWIKTGLMGILWM